MVIEGTVSVCNIYWGEARMFNNNAKIQIPEIEYYQVLHPHRGTLFDMEDPRNLRKPKKKYTQQQFTGASSLLGALLELAKYAKIGGFQITLARRYKTEFMETINIRPFRLTNEYPVNRGEAPLAEQYDLVKHLFEGCHKTKIMDIFGKHAESRMDEENGWTGVTLREKLGEHNMSKSSNGSTALKGKGKGKDQSNRCDTRSDGSSVNSSTS